MKTYLSLLAVALAALLVIPRLTVKAAAGCADGDTSNNTLVCDITPPQTGNDDDQFDGDLGDDIMTQAAGVTTVDIDGDGSKTHDFRGSGDGGNDTIYNYGTVTANIAGDWTAGNGGNDIIYNYGEVQINIWGDEATGVGGNDTIINYGTVNGTINGEGGNDVVIIMDGSSGGPDNLLLLEGGTGYDVLIFRFNSSATAAEVASALSGKSPASGSATIAGKNYTWTNFEEFRNEAGGAPTPTVQPTTMPSGLHSLWTTGAVPATANVMGTTPIELGVKFKTSTNATAVGLRFYKGSANTGTHTGHLWTANGTLLATGVFTNETASGWQTVSFPSPISITANTTYIASYYSPTGRFSNTPNYFANSRLSGILTAPNSVAAGGNGVYTRGANGSFPVSTSNNNNYWVDVLVQPSSSPATAVPTLTPTVQPTTMPSGLHSLWTTGAAPATANVMGTTPIELGVKFYTSTNATAVGLRFYKGSANTGTHTGHLWTANGTLLATGVFINETASGWQTVSFPSPIPITANTTYIASYYSPTGRFSNTANYFANSRLSGILTAPNSVAAGGNGVFTRGPNGSFPVSTSNNNNFWVDVLVQPSSGASSAFATTPTPQATSTAAPTATLTPTAVPQTVTFTRQIIAGGDDVNQSGATFQASAPAVWMGDGYTGLRFTNIQVPRGATITAAHLMVYSADGQWVSLNLQIAGDAADNSLPFSAGMPPSVRRLTTARVSHSSNDNWAANTWYTFGDMRSVVQEIINRPNWQVGNSLSVILNGTGTRKFISAFEYSAGYAPRLVVTYTK